MAGPRVILMYISEVSGHHSATIALEKALKLIRPDAEILNINAFNYTNPISEKVINRLYLNIIKRMPQVWDYLYDNPDVVKKVEKIKTAVHKLNSPKLKKLFDEFKPDIVVCSQAFPCGMVADFKKTYGSGLPLVAVLTDYIPHSYWIYDAVDYYIAPSEEVRAALMQKGVVSEKVKPLGIPIDPKFCTPRAKDAIIRELGLRPDICTILIMGGGQGLGPIKTIISAMEKIETPFQEIIVAGTNKKLFNTLEKRIAKYKKRIFLFPYTDKIDELMSIADLVITKPGGLTTAEALARKLPMIIIRPIPGQEQSNTAYLTGKNVALKISKSAEIIPALEGLLKNPEKMSMMSEAAGRIGRPDSSFQIAKLLLENLKPYA